MADPFLSEIRIFAFNFAPQGWATCDGQILQVNQNQALYSLLGARYGGDGSTTFGLPNLNGRVPVAIGGAAGTVTGAQGSMGGEASHVLQATEVPVHTHAVNVSSTTANQPLPTAHVLAAPATAIYAPDNPAKAALLDPSSVATVGGAGHENRQPSLGLNFCIALMGIYPPRN